MDNSILSSIKLMLGIEPEYSVFDKDLIIHINTAVSVLYQLGFEAADGFSITGTNEQWPDLLGDTKNIDMIKSLVYLRVRKVFDPPQSQAAVSAIDDQIKELEWRINIEVDKGGTQ